MIPIKSHWVAASHIGSIAQERAAIKTAATETMKKMSDDDFMPICSPPLVFTLLNSAKGGPRAARIWQGEFLFYIYIIANFSLIVND